MIYANGTAFRQELEQHLLNISLDKGIPLSRLRKTVAFERFLFRLIRTNPNSWILKGGLNMELRLGQNARMTKDIDLLTFEKPEQIHELLVESFKFDCGDFFAFNIENPNNRNFEPSTGYRFNVLSRLDGRQFEQFHIDVGTNDILTEPPDILKMKTYLDFAKIATISVPCYSIYQQIAEKFHAMTKTYSSGESSRVKDLVDILALASISELDLDKLIKSVTLTFNHRASHSIPLKIIGIETTYQRTFSNLASQINLKFQRIEDANIILKDLFAPIISNEKSLSWNPDKFVWVKKE